MFFKNKTILCSLGLITLLSICKKTHAVSCTHIKTFWFDHGGDLMKSSAFCFSPTPDLVALYDGTSSKLYSIKDNKFLPGKDFAGNVVAFSPDGKMLFTECKDENFHFTTHLYDTATRNIVRSISGSYAHFLPTTDFILINPDASEDLVLFDTTTWQAQKRIGINDYKLSPNAENVFNKRNGHVYQTATGKDLLSCNCADGEFSCDGKTFIAQDYCDLHVYDIATGQKRLTITGGLGAVCADGKKVAVFSKDDGNTASVIIDTISGEKLTTVKGFVMQFHPKNEAIVLVRMPKDNLLLYDCAAQKQIQFFDNATNYADFSSDGKSLMIAEEDNSLSLWRIEW